MFHNNMYLNKRDIGHFSIFKELVCIVKFQIKIFFYRSVLFIDKKKDVEKKYNVVICAIFKNEGLYLKEWIEYNKIIGVDHIYLYNNFSTDNYQSILQSYLDGEYVTLVDWPIKQGQIAAYYDCVDKYSDSCRWIGFIDIDEFIVPKEYDNIYSFLRRYNNYPSVKFYWKVFGSSGKIDRNNTDLVTESFVLSWSDYDCVGKCFYNTKYQLADYKTNSIVNHMCFAKVRNIVVPPVNHEGKFCSFYINKIKDKDFSVQINHYFTKTYNEYHEKINKGDAFYTVNPKDVLRFFEHDNFSIKPDYSIYKYLIKLKIAMGIKK